jgi:hypothetical protein
MIEEPIMQRYSRRALSRLGKVVGLGAAVLAGIPYSTAMAAGDIDGVWEIVRPTRALSPVDGIIPFTAEGRKLYDAHQTDRARGVYDYDLTQSRCSSPGPTRLMLSPGRLRIRNRPDVVAIQFEWNHMLRQIDMRDKPSAPPFATTMNGFARGHWKGGTLAVSINGISDRTLLDDLLPHSDDLQLTEQIRLVDSNTLEERITIRDPAIYTRPWDAVITYKRVADTPFDENICLDRLAAGQLPLPR